jgi:hypothetical protein
MSTPANAFNITNAGLIRFNGTSAFSSVTVTQNSALVGAASNGISSIALTNGQLLVGSTGASPVAAALTAGSGITITNGAGSIEIASSATAVTWSDESTSFTAAASHGYFVSGAATATLPASPSQGDTISFAYDGATGALTITANTGQVIRQGTAVSATGGTCVSSARGDSITLVYRTSGAAWIGINACQGSWVIT